MTFIKDSWTADALLAQEVADRFDSAIAAYKVNPNLISEHANHEESIRVGAYATRTLLELVQNAADAMSGASGNPGMAAGRVEIILDTDSETLYCANAGRPFSKNGITAVTHAHLSGKRGDEIGRFGLGFKSSLAVSDAPQVFSRTVSFEFNSPTAQGALADIRLSRRYPILRTPTLVDPAAAFNDDPILADLAEWAATVVRLPRVSNLKRLRQGIKDFSSEFLLFVTAVREVKLKVMGSEPFETTYVSRDLGDGIYKIEEPSGDGDEWIVEHRMHAPPPRPVSRSGRPSRERRSRSPSRSPGARPGSASGSSGPTSRSRIRPRPQPSSTPRGASTTTEQRFSRTTTTGRSSGRSPRCSSACCRG